MLFVDNSVSDAINIREIREISGWISEGMRHLGMKMEDVGKLEVGARMVGGQPTGRFIETSLPFFGIGSCGEGDGRIGCGSLPGRSRFSSEGRGKSGHQRAMCLVKTGDGRFQGLLDGKCRRKQTAPQRFGTER